MRVAFFDMDKTLIRANSGTLWVRHELRAGRIGWRDAARAAVFLTRYALGFGELDGALRAAIATLEGQDEATLRARTHAFYDDEVRGLIRSGAREAVERHRAAGDRLALLTSSSPYLSERICQDLDIADFLCNRFETADGRFTGRAIEPLCFGEGKRALAARYAAERGIALADCAFYTDSMSDVSVLEVVGRPVVIDPDPKLRRLARRRGWPIEDWG